MPLCLVWELLEWIDYTRTNLHTDLIDHYFTSKGVMRWQFNMNMNRRPIVAMESCCLQSRSLSLHLFQETLNAAFAGWILFSIFNVHAPQSYPSILLNQNLLILCLALFEQIVYFIKFTLRFKSTFGLPQPRDRR